MDQKLCNELFSNLYQNKIIYHERVTVFCNLLNYDYANNILTVNFKVIEPVLKIKPHLHHFYENLKQNENIEIKARIPSDYNRIYIEERKLTAFGSFGIWTGSNLIKEIYVLKKEDNEEEIFQKLWS